MTMRGLAITTAMVIGLGGLMLSVALAQQKKEGEMVEGSGFSLFDTESIVGFDEDKVKKDPVCDPSRRPKIHRVEPDVMKPGDRIVITGENFGKRECFRGVNFSKASGVDVEFKYVNESTIEATVPKDAPSGMTFVLTITNMGSAQSNAVLITK